MKHGREYREFAREVMREEDRDYDGLWPPTNLDDLNPSDVKTESPHTLDPEADWQEEYDGQSTLEEADQESLDYLFGEVLDQDEAGEIDPREAEKMAGVTREPGYASFNGDNDPRTDGGRRKSYDEKEDDRLALGELTERGKKILDTYNQG